MTKETRRSIIIAILVIILVLTPFVMREPAFRNYLSQLGLRIILPNGWGLVPFSDHISYSVVNQSNRYLTRTFEAEAGDVLTIRYRAFIDFGGLTMTLTSAEIATTQVWSKELVGSNIGEVTLQIPRTGSYNLRVRMWDFTGDFDVGWLLP